MAKRKATSDTTLDFGFGANDNWETARLMTGLVPVDYSVSGGFGYGRATELFGNYSSGKTYLLYLALIENQRQGGTSILFEEEGAFEPSFFRMLGGNPDTLIIPPDVDTVEDIFNTLHKNIIPTSLKNPKHKIAVGWDSIACTATAHLEEVGMDKRDMSKAEAISRGCSLIRADLKRSGIALIATNQTRVKIGTYGSPSTTPGGVGYPFLCSTRVELAFDGGNSTSLITKKGDPKYPIGRWIRTKVEKNKLGPAMRLCSLPFYIERGQEHPLYGYPVEIGIDANEALWDFYNEGRFRLPVTNPDAKPWEGQKVVESSSPGWFQLSEQIDTAVERKKFRASDWMEMLDKYPILKTLPMDSLKA